MRHLVLNLCITITFLFSHLTATVLATVVTVGWYYGVVKARRDVYAEFHRTYDPDAAYERMKSKGVFWAFKAIDEYKAEQEGKHREGQC